MATIEHGTYLDEEAAREMVKRGAVLVPTRFIIEHLLAMRNAMPDYAFHKLAALAERHAQAMRIAVEFGVKIAMGTDIFVSGPAMWGKNGMEASYLVKAGMTPLQAIESATANGPVTLGPQAPKSGVLAPDFDADVTTLDAGPLGDISVQICKVNGVWKAVFSSSTKVPLYKESSLLVFVQVSCGKEPRCSSNLARRTTSAY